MAKLTAKWVPESTIIKLTRIKDINDDVLRGIRQALIWLGTKVAESITFGRYGVKTDRGRLRSSFGIGDKDNRFIVRKVGQGILGIIGSNVKYAAIQERGGIIKAKSGRALAIPVHPLAKAKTGPRDFGDTLTLIPRKGRPPLLVKKVGGAAKRFEIMYVLKKSVKIPAHFYMRKTLFANKTRALQIIEAEAWKQFLR